jgi:hypothetical protein
MFRRIAVTSLYGSAMALALAFSTAMFAQAMAADNPMVAVPQKSVAQATVKHLMVARGDVRIDVLAQGSGPVIVILPSLGRGAEDYDFVAKPMVSAYYDHSPAVLEPALGQWATCRCTTWPPMSPWSSSMKAKAR